MLLQLLDVCTFHILVKQSGKYTRWYNICYHFAELSV